ncbi:flagellar hook-length control protein FliK [Pseudotabrizicola algicola]|uniref:flagellar hook-length control protein FliK n=1 Tax=Pseudotabrizicola algicola TaxID=2709381 RepID=UPI0013E06ED1
MPAAALLPVAAPAPAAQDACPIDLATGEAEPEAQSPQPDASLPEAVLSAENADVAANMPSVALQPDAEEGAAPSAPEEQPDKSKAEGEAAMPESCPAPRPDPAPVQPAVLVPSPPASASTPPAAPLPATSEPARTPVAPDAARQAITPNALSPAAGKSPASLRVDPRVHHPAAGELPAPPAAPEAAPSAAQSSGAPAPFADPLARAAGANPPAQAPVQMMRSDWPQAVVSATLSQLSDLGGTMVLELAPDDLGAMRITLTIEGQAASVRIQTETPEAARLLNEAERQLAQDFERQGVTLASHDAQTGRRNDPAVRPPAGRSAAPHDSHPSDSEVVLLPRGLVNLIA